jgi:hypothetical protein
MHQNAEQMNICATFGKPDQASRIHQQKGVD